MPHSSVNFNYTGGLLGDLFSESRLKTTYFCGKKVSREKKS